KKGEKVGAQGGGNLPPPSGSKGKTRDKVAEAVGMSGRTYEKAKQVVEAAEADPETVGDLAEKMDKNGSVDAAHQEMKRRAGSTTPDASAGEEAERRQRQRERAFTASANVIDYLKTSPLLRIGRKNPFRDDAFADVQRWLDHTRRREVFNDDL